jgi:hypothetical protein
MMWAGGTSSELNPGQQVAVGIGFIVMGCVLTLYRRRLWPIMVSRRFSRMNIDEWGEGRGWFVYSFVLIPCVFVVAGVFMIVGVVRS